jgi:uncharacterized protein (DUF2147 family)
MRKPCLAALGAALSLLPIAAAQGAPAGPAGVWRNPKNSVHVRIEPCGANVCGTVVWANERARMKARNAGTPNLIGKQLFQEFHQEAAGAWAGRVFVPDMDRTVSGRLRTQGPDNVVASGCLLGRFLCKSQTWTRVR